MYSIVLETFVAFQDIP